MSTQIELPHYRCHKEVQALKIKELLEDEPDGKLRIAFVDGEYAPLCPCDEWIHRWHGTEDDLGYYVRYADGYESWSPSDAFEDGYNLIDSSIEDERIARVAHQVNRAYCQALGDDSQPSWDEAPEWQRESAINGVMFHRATPHASPAQSHAEWLSEKERDGWVYGPVKDEQAKTHPCMVSYNELPLEQRAKDFIFSAVVRSMMGDFTKRADRV